MGSITVIKNQTIYDICLQAYGTVEALSEILALNPDLQNDPLAKISLGIDPITNTSFFLHLALKPDLEVIVNTDSPLINANVLKELTEPITTFNI